MKKENSRQAVMRNIALACLTAIIWGAPACKGEGRSRIAFVSARGGNLDVMLMNPDGSGQQALTQSEGWDGDFAWSPDGRRIAYVNVRDGTKGIVVMNADGSDKVRLATGMDESFSPAWSPDGTRIAFMSARDGNIDICVMNADGTAVRQLTRNPGTNALPRWSPDGRRIAFVSDRDGEEGDGVNRLEIWAMDADGTGQVRLTHNQAFDGWPAWAPDGRKIAFESARDGNFEIYLMDPDGARQSRLTQSSDEDRGPVWSPDGGKILFERGRPRSIYVVSADGSAEQRLTNGPEWDFVPQWSPDGRRIAFVRVVQGPGDSPHGGDEEIFVMNADGSQIKRLTRSPGVDYAPSWRPGSGWGRTSGYDLISTRWLLRHPAQQLAGVPIFAFLPAKPLPGSAVIACRSRCGARS